MVSGGEDAVERVGDDLTSCAAPFFRAAHDASDYRAIAAVVTACAARDGLDPLSIERGAPSTADLARRFSPDRAGADLRLVQVGDAVVGYRAIWSWDQVDGPRSYAHDGFVVPAYRRGVIGPALLRWAEERIAALIAEQRPAATVLIRSYTAATEEDTHQLLVRAGYAWSAGLVELVLETGRPLAPTVTPPGFAIRAAEPGQVRAIWAAKTPSRMSPPMASLVRKGTPT